jgi:hypothetical protein
MLELIIRDNNIDSKSEDKPTIWTSPTVKVSKNKESLSQGKTKKNVQV